jgi:hypothetical protein
MPQRAAVRRVLGLFVICGPIAACAHADVVTINAAHDNTLYEDSTGSVSNGAGSAMFAGRNSQTTDSVRRALLSFDIAAAIPADATINTVTLTLFNDAANATPALVSLHRVTQAWGEGSSIAAGGQGNGAPATPGDATWLHTFFPASMWANPGGDFVATATAALSVAGPGTYTWTSTPQFVGDVQDFLDAPPMAFGWVLIGDEFVASSAKRFSTREATIPDNRPALTVDYTPVPEPVSFWFFAIAAALSRRRR